MRYFRKPEVVEAEQVDLKDIVQLARLGITCYDDALGRMGSVQTDPTVRTQIRTGDWLVIPADYPKTYKKVLSDADFKSQYAPASVPAEVQFPPEVYQKLAELTPEEEAEIRKMEEEDRNEPPK